MSVGRQAAKGLGPTGTSRILRMKLELNRLGGPTTGSRWRETHVRQSNGASGQAALRCPPSVPAWKLAGRQSMRIVQWGFEKEDLVRAA